MSQNGHHNGTPKIAPKPGRSIRVRVRRCEGPGKDAYWQTFQISPGYDPRRWYYPKGTPGTRPTRHKQ